MTNHTSRFINTIVCVVDIPGLSMSVCASVGKFKFGYNFCETHGTIIFVVIYIATTKCMCAYKALTCGLFGDLSVTNRIF